MNGSVKLEKKNNVPFCYVVERRSAVNAGVANICNLINYAVETGSQAVSGLQKLFGLGDDKKPKTQTETETKTENKTETKTENKTSTDSSKTAAQTEQPDASTQKKTTSEDDSEMVSGFISEIKTLFNGLTSGVQELIKNNNLNNSILLPYKYLYITKSTGKSYVFPLANNASSFTSLTNAWGNGAQIPGPLQKLADGAYSFLDATTKGLNLIENTKNFLNGEGDDINYIREMAKSYSYPQNGDKVLVNFTLYNTTQLNAWKKNYKFLFLFILRNLPLRINVASFVPPLLYDVIVPGIKHLPVCSVAGVNVVPKGLIRTLTMDNFMGPGTLLVNVPEAWEVTITFQCLIGHSANLVLSGINSALNISTNTSAKNPENSEKTTEPNT